MSQLTFPKTSVIKIETLVQVMRPMDGLGSNAKFADIWIVLDLGLVVRPHELLFTRQQGELGFKFFIQVLLQPRNILEH